MRFKRRGKNKTDQLNVHPISMCMHKRDLLYFLSVINANYNINISTISNVKSTETRQSKKLKVQNYRHRLLKCRKNIWNQSTRLYNILRNTTDKPKSKNFLKRLYATFFHRLYNELDSCSWRIFCNSGNCYSQKNLC